MYTNNMMQIAQDSKEKVLEAIHEGRIDAADISRPNFIDSIVLKMYELGVIDDLDMLVKDKRKPNTVIPLKFIWTLAIAAKMKVHTSLTDIPFGITDGEVLASLGYSLWDLGRDLEKGLMDEGAIRHIIGKYDRKELVSGYNNFVQTLILPRVGVQPNVHILDCTKLEVELKNENYEESSVVKEEGKSQRGYKLSTLRGITGDSGIIEEIRLGTIKEHDLELSREILSKSEMLKSGDILINDRGFLSREIMNDLKTRREVDTYIPLKKNMNAYQDAVTIAKTEGRWQPHPNKKRKTQKIAFVPEIGAMWQSDEPDKDVPLNACVIFDSKDGEYYVFVTTDTSKTAKSIIKTYELRPEIEEDYRQLKDFWCLDDFKSTKINVITFHVICTLLGYLMFQLYVGTEEGSSFSGKSLPVVVKKYIPTEKPKSVVIYVGQYFAVFHFVELLHLYSSLAGDIRSRLDSVLALL